MNTEKLRINGHAVNRERLKRGMGRMDFYKALGCDPRTGRRIIAGGGLRADVVLRVAKVLGLNPADVIVLDA